MTTSISEKDIQHLEEYLKRSGIYYQLKKCAQDEITRATNSPALQQELDKFINYSGFDIILENEIYKFFTHPAYRHVEKDDDSKRNGHFDYIKKAQVSWEKCIIKSINSMCTEMAFPLSRKRAVKDQELFAANFNALAIGTNYDEEEYKKLRPVYSSADFLEALVAIKNPNYAMIRPTSNLQGWGLIKTPIRTKDMDELRNFFSYLNRSYPQCGIDDLSDVSPDSFHQDWYKLGSKVLKRGHSAAARQYAKQGCPTGHRKELWMLILGLKIDNLDSIYFEQLKNYVFEYDLLVDQLIMKDVRLTTTNDDSFFVFEDLLHQVLLIMSRDTWLLERCRFLNSSPPKSYIKGKLGIPECQVHYPPSGIIPFHGFAMYDNIVFGGEQDENELKAAAPLCYIYDDAMMLYYVFRDLYLRYFCRLHVISTDDQGILALCALFENLLQCREPWLCKHFMDIDSQPLRIVFNWIIFGFSGYLATDQTLQLWDRILGFDSLELLSVLAVAILSYRRENLMAADSSQSVEAVLADLSTIKVIPLLVSFLNEKPT